MSKVSFFNVLPQFQVSFPIDKLKSSRLRQVILMTKSEKRMWLTNIENAGDAVVAEYGSEVV